MPYRIGTWTLRVISDFENADQDNQEVYDEVANQLGDVEDLVNGWLPEGYYCKVDDARDAR